MKVLKATMFVGTLLAAAGQGAFVHAQGLTIEQRVKAIEDALKSPTAPRPKSGNKNVTLQIDGHVNQGGLYYNDGTQDYANYVDGNASHSRVRFTGAHRFDNKSGVAARIEVGIQPNSTTSVSQVTRSTGTSGTTLDFRKVEVWYRNDDYGQISLGQGDMASNDTSHADLSGTALASDSTPADIAGGVILRTSAGAFSGVLIKNVFDDYDGLSRKERIRYDSPKVAGFVLSASHNGVRQYDVALVQTGKYGDFNVWAAGAYSRDTANKYDLFNGSFSIMHVPTGLSVTVAGASKNNDTGFDPSFYYVKGGYQAKFFRVGKTAISGDYYHSTDTKAAGDKADGWSIAVVQKIDAASAEIYASYHNYDYKQVAADFQSVDAAIVGARIKF